MSSLVIYDHSDFIKIIDLWVKFLIGLLRLFSLNSYQLIISFQTAFNSCLSLFVLSELLDSPYAIVVGGGGEGWGRHWCIWFSPCLENVISYYKTNWSSNNASNMLV